jgi:general secretion pathway protein B
MSYIFQALKRAAEERESGVVTVRPSAAPASAVTRRPRWAWAAVAALALNAVVLLVVFGPSLRGHRAPTAPDVRGVPSTAPAQSSDAARPVSSGRAVSAPATLPQPAGRRDEGAGREQARDRTVKPPAPAAPTTGPVTRATPAPVAEQVKPTSPAPASGPVTRTTPPAASSEVKRATPGSRATRATPAPVSRESSSATASSATGELKRATPTVPSSEKAASRDGLKGPAPPSDAAQAKAAPREPRASVPVPARGGTAPAPDRPAASVQPGDEIGSRAQKLALQALVYSEVPRQRMVFINGRKYVEGDTVEGDLRLETITEEGALLSYQGQRYLLREPSSR